MVSTRTDFRPALALRRCWVATRRGSRRARTGCANPRGRGIAWPPNGHREYAPALSLYDGKVMHARLKPVGHRFTYSVASMLIDLDRLDEADKTSPIFSVNKRNLVAFHEKDHGPRDGTRLRDHVDRLMRNAGLSRPSRVELLCYPSVLGYTFNPMSVYFCRDESGEITALDLPGPQHVRRRHTVTSNRCWPARPRQPAYGRSGAKAFMSRPSSTWNSPIASGSGHRTTKLHCAFLKPIGTVQYWPQPSTA